MAPQNESKDFQTEFRDRIDDYEQTIHALIGFMNFYRYDDQEKRFRDDVIT